MIVDDIFGDFGFRVVWYDTSKYFAYMKVYKVAARGEDCSPEFVNRYDSVHKDYYLVKDTDNAEIYLEGYIKWDGCTELDMGCPHWCSPEHYQQHCDLLKYLYHRAFESMGRQDEMEPWPNPSLIKEKDECQIAYMGRND